MGWLVLMAAKVQVLQMCRAPGTGAVIIAFATTATAWKLAKGTASTVCMRQLAILSLEPHLLDGEREGVIFVSCSGRAAERPRPGQGPASWGQPIKLKSGVLACLEAVHLLGLTGWLVFKRVCNDVAGLFPPGQAAQHEATWCRRADVVVLQLQQAVLHGKGSK